MAPLLLALVLAAPSVALQASVDGKPAAPGWVWAKKGQVVTLEALVRGGEAQDVRWFRIEPTAGALDNTTPAFHFEAVPYAETEITACAGQRTCPADVTPTRLPPVAALPGVGTMAFKLRVTFAGGVVMETPGAERTKWGGLTPEVLRVTFRADDSLIGFASELLNTPYIFGSAGPDGRNQSDLLIGADCADLIIYGRRRGGHRARYTSSYAIDQQAPELKRGTPRRGDLVHFPSSRHVALLYEDRAPLGVVDEDDLILHTCWAPPTVQRLGDSGCASRPFRVLRFPGD